MDVEVLEIRDFLGQHPPFSLLDEAKRGELARRIKIKYVKSGDIVLGSGVKNDHLYMVRSGAVDLHEGGTRFHARLGEGQYFAYPSLMRDGITRNETRAIEDTLLYLLDGPTFLSLCDEAMGVGRFFLVKEADRLRHAVATVQAEHLDAEKLQLVKSRVSDLMSGRELVVCTPDLPMGEVADRMAAEDVSTMLVCEGDKLAGIFTDKDLRRRVAARRLDWSTPIREVMTVDPWALPAESTAFEALLTMTRRNIHHLPVLGDQGGPIGLISANDILSKLSANAVYVVARIEKAGTLEEVRQAVQALPQSVVSLVQSGAEAYDTGAFISSIGEAAHRRVAELIEAELGPPPVPYALLVFGSLARQDQTAKTDQDNALLISDDYDEAKHGEYFTQFGEKLAAALNVAGYPLCNGEIMASNPKWRQSYSGWKAIFERWITQPEPSAIMHATIFFDHRAVHGDISLAENLRAFVLGQTEGDKIFLAHLTQDALRATVPLGFFRQLVLLKNKEHKNTLNLKKQGIVPLVDMVRLYALAYGLRAINSRDRLDAAERAGVVSTQDAADMKGALAFISQVRLRHQAAQIQEGREPDNFVSTNELSRFEREHLRDAFSIIRTAQEAAAVKFAGGFLI